MGYFKSLNPCCNNGLFQVIKFDERKEYATATTIPERKKYKTNTNAKMSERKIHNKILKYDMKITNPCHNNGLFQVIMFAERRYIEDIWCIIEIKKQLSSDVV